MGASETDVLVFGAGPVGCTLALALRNSGLRTALLEHSSPPASSSFRPIALSYASRLILERVGAWQQLAATPIDSVQVSQLGAFGRTRLEAKDAGVPALGYVVDYAMLASALRSEVEKQGVARTEEELPARCAVHAEGSAATAEEKRYSQDAVVGLVRRASLADATAHERFTPEGPLALLPFSGRYALVWSVRPERARQLAEMPDAEFLRELSATAGSRFGMLTAIEARAVLPLALRVRSARIGARSVYIGNAAQTLHPVAGQGLNLGLRDAWDLAQILREASDPGDAATLARYAATRRVDAGATIGMTDFLARAFAGTGLLSRAARGLMLSTALTAIDVLPGPRRFFARRMIYGPSALP
jgi:2-octaprenyl-6-methoxyphenol hydroxylase